MMARRWARMVERCCCTFATYLPLIFVYSLTSWAVWVLVEIGNYSTKSAWVGKRLCSCRYCDGNKN